MTPAERDLVISTAQAVATLMATRENSTMFTDKVSGRTVYGYEIANILIDKVDAVKLEGPTS